MKEEKKDQKTLPNTDYANLENIGLTVCEQQQIPTIRDISHLLQKRKRTFKLCLPGYWKQQ